MKYPMFWAALLTLGIAAVIFYLVGPCRHLDWMPSGLLPYRCSLEYAEKEAIESFDPNVLQIRP